MPLFTMALPVCSTNTHRVPGVVCGFGDHARRPRWITDHVLMSADASVLTYAPGIKLAPQSYRIGTAVQVASCTNSVR